MRASWAMIRASWLTAATYKVSLVISVAGLLFAVVPLYFVANALQPMMANAIRTEGHQYFGFVLVGTVVFSFITIAVRGLPGAIGSGIGNGSLESILGTPAGTPAVLVGLTGYSFLWATARAMLTVAFGALLGASVAWQRVPSAVLILGLIVASYIPIGLIGAAMMLRFRTVGPLLEGVIIASSLLGGVYYPTHVIPSWIEGVSAFVPLTYGLRALRRVLLDGASLTTVGSDVLTLTACAVALFAVGVWVFAAALRHARRTGTLSYY